MEETGGGGWPRKASRGNSLTMRSDLLAGSSSSSTASSSSSLSSSMKRGGRVASAINSLQREGGDVGGVSRRDSAGGGFGGQGSIPRETRCIPPPTIGWGSSTSREGMVAGEGVTRVSLRKEEGGRREQSFYKHSVAESDSESTGYASISFSDSDTGSDDQGGGGGGDLEEESVDSSLVIEQEDHEEEVVVMRDLGKELECSDEGVDRRHGGYAGAAPGPSKLTGVTEKPLVTGVTPRPPLVTGVAKPQGHVGFSSLPDQVNVVMVMVMVMLMLI